MQQALCQIIHADTIVVGHSLNNDLNVLRLQHWQLIDTAMLFAVPSLGHRTFALRVRRGEIEAISADALLPTIRQDLVTELLQVNMQPLGEAHGEEGETVA